MDWSAEDKARRERDRRLIQDGVEVWQCKKNLQELQNLEDQRQVSIYTGA